MAKSETIESNVYCSAAGVNEKIGVRLITGKQREELLTLRRNFVDRYLTLYFKARGGIWKTTLALTNSRLEKLPIALVQCKQALPAEAEVNLVWGAGVASESGIATTEDQTLPYQTRPEFNAKFSCSRTNSSAQCIPFLPMSLSFSAPIRIRDAKAITLSGNDGKVYRPIINSDEKKNDYVSSVTFKGPLPENKTFKLAIPPQLKDDAGRSLFNRDRFPLTVRTDEQPPLVKFPSRFGIIEKGGDHLLPVTVRNIESSLSATVATGAIKGEVLRVVGRPKVAAKGASTSIKDGVQDAEQDQDAAIISWMKRLNGGGGESWEVGDTWINHIRQSIFSAADSTSRFNVPRTGNKKAFEVIGIPLKKPGFYVVELQSPKLGAAITESGGTAFIQSAALVTNLAAHFKRGAESSLVWVTSLDKGEPVANAKVIVRSCDGKPQWHGLTDKFGVASIQQSLPRVRCGYNSNYFVSARSDDDVTFTLSDWKGGIESWRFSVPTVPFDADNIMADTVFDRTLLRAGETVHMKHFLRKHTMNGIRFVNADDSKPKARVALRKKIKGKLASTDTGPAKGSDDVEDQKLIITHEGTQQQFELPFHWNSVGTAESNWQVPTDAKQGTYRLTIGNYAAGSFRVEAFRVPTMKAILQAPKAALIQARKFDLDVQLNYLAGGGASNAQVKLRTVIHDKVVSIPEYSDFAFSNGDVKEGIVKESGSYQDDEGFQDDGQAQEEDASGVVVSSGKGGVKTRALALDGSGAARMGVSEFLCVRRLGC